MRRLLPPALVLGLALLLTVTAAGSAARPAVTVVLNGQVLSLDTAYIEEGRTMVSLRSVAEALGLTVTWNQLERTAYLSDGSWQPTFQDVTVALDPGHGGSSTGAQYNGIRESDLNLAVVRRVDLLAGFCGVPTVLTREDDRSLHDEEAETLREKKRSDLENRVALVEGTEGAVLLSVHQNSYPDGRYSGAQVFYSNEALSGAWAEVTQETLRTALDQENHRLAKVIPDSVYLMNHISCPALLVECGFLSNPEEARRLETGEYQTKIALSLVAAYLQAQGGGGAEP